MTLDKIGARCITQILGLCEMNRRLILWLLIAVAIFMLALFARLLPGPRTIDDAYITFRYVRNILAGVGFVYNPGEHVLGTTTPLYTFLLAAVGSLFGGDQANFPQIAYVINAFADAITCLLLLQLGRRLGSPAAGVGAALVWAIAPYSVTFAIGGLETSVYVLLLMGMVTAYLYHAHILAALLAALSVLTRPDALILIGPLVLDRLWQVRTDLKNKPNAGFTADNREKITTTESFIIEILTFFLPLVAWIIFSIAYFGSPLPHSIIAKSLAYRLPPDAAFIRLLQHYATPFLGQLSFGIPWIGIGMVLYLFLFVLGARGALKYEPHAWPLVAYPWLYFATFAIANPLIFRWYLTPPLPILQLVILIGLDILLRDLLSKLRTQQTEENFSYPRRIAPWVAIAFVIFVPSFLSLRGWRLQPDHGLDRPAPDMAWYKLELLYQEAAGLLADEISQHPMQTVLAAGDVGALGYYTEARILDTVGLNSPQSTRYYPANPEYYVINYAIPPRLITENQPDFIVILEVYGRAGLLKDPLFQAEYALRHKIPTDIYESDGMLIFAHRSLSQAP